jgi:hypothetical protein
MIILVTYIDEKNGKRYVSHGIDEDDRVVILPTELLEYFKPRYLPSIGEYVIFD